MKPPPTLQARLDEVAGVDRLLVAVDFDGTISDIVAHPADARPRCVAASTLSMLACLPRTHVAIVSGRSLHDLRRAVADIAGCAAFHLYGSHGLEGEDGNLIGLGPGAARRRSAIERLARYAVEQYPAAWIEPKSYGEALHYGGLDDSGGRRLEATVQRMAEALPGCFVKRGKRVIEVSALPMNKGFAIDLLQHGLAPDVTVYAGDDHTDEDAFDALWPCDIGIKVGREATHADHQVESPAALEAVLARLHDRRRQLLSLNP